MTVGEPSPYAEPRLVSNLEDCLFYHTMDLPGVGVVEGPWDLREGVAKYLGGVDFGGKRALDVGTASGFLCFEMERRGAEVVAYDLNESCDGWDIVPFGGRPAEGMVVEWAEGMRRINNGFWLAHAVLGSRARMAYGSVYCLPRELGPFDISVFGAILLHLRDPFHALQRALSVTTECVVVTEPAGRSARALGRLPKGLRCRLASSSRLPASLGFLPDPALGRPDETWWDVTPWALIRMLGVLGFSLASLDFHSPIYQGRPWPMYTVVARRVALKPG